MSDGPELNTNRVRREQRACDLCRRRRRACDGSRTPPKSCTLCTEMQLECKFTGLVAKRRTYVEALEERVKDVEKKLEDLGPAILETPNVLSSGGIGQSGPGVQLAALSIRSMNVPAPLADDVENLALIKSMHTMSMLSSSHDDHFHGEVSSLIVVKKAIDLREDYEKKQLRWSARRERYWAFFPPTRRIKHTGPYVFTPPDLLASLVDLYFEHHNAYIPLLHRPTFERHLSDGLHIRDKTFGGIVQLVCALGSRYSDDPRLGVPGGDELLQGYEFLDQVTIDIDHVFGRPEIHHVQLYCLIVIFCDQSNHSSCWTVLGAAIRMVQDVGAHRRPRKPIPTSVESELWKRAFWACFTLDRQLCIAIGRPSMILWRDFDVDLPLEVDDVHWEDGFVQPPGEISSLAYFNTRLKLDIILGFAVELLYPLQKVKRPLAFNNTDWEAQIVAELDSALNEWLQDVPEHLRWDRFKQAPDSDRNELFFKQSAELHCHFHLIQIMVHRQFVPQLTKNLLTTLPSLSVCTNAARSCAHIVNKLNERHYKGMTFPRVLYPTFLSGLFFVLNVWNGKRTGLPPHMNSSMNEVRMCMEFIKGHDKRWLAAGIFWDVLFELGSIGDLPMQQQPTVPTSSGFGSHANSKKRSRRDPSSAASTAVYASDTRGQQDPIPAGPINSTSTFADSDGMKAPERIHHCEHDGGSHNSLDCLLDHHLDPATSWYNSDPITNFGSGANADNVSQMFEMWAAAPSSSLDANDWYAYFNSIGGM
ncbi:Fungal-trans domain-containing protein [Mycena indigotica]|uniref:Fungal-trans domain-containing protein n=1 Tax=Mycena indigotica TaxID=2126181 RepID=A0A8H6SNS6_9AGAR|nr:Fungal-trans domain-containing protein [Mycena indigotica]KAF7301210.1 Fungal-trans domain-containing protein [Mycena indigotica]